MKNYKFLALIALLVACGGEATGTYSEADAGVDADTVLGNSEQALSSQTATSQLGAAFTSGAMWDPTPLQSRNTYNCSVFMSDDLECFLPPFKSFTVKVKNSGCTTSEFSTFSTRVNTIISNMNSSLGNNGWSITRNDSTGKQIVQCQPLPVLSTQAGGGPDGIRTYSRVVCQPDQTNVVNDQGAQGIHVRYTTCVVAVDMTKVLARGANANEDTLLAYNAIGYGMNMLVGVGESSVIGGTYSNSTITPIAWPAPGRVQFSTGALCRTKFYLDAVGSNPTIYGTSSSKHCDDN